MKSFCMGLIAAAVLQSSAPAVDLAISVEPTTSPAGASSAEPQVTVDRGRAILSWVELAGKHTTLRFARHRATNS